MTPNGRLLLIGAAFLALAQTSWGQKAANWRVYKVADGLPESACVSVAIGAHDKIWATHPGSPFVSELDGYTIGSIPSPDIGSGRVRESPGGQLWTIVSDGLEEFREGAWVRHPVQEIADEFRVGRRRAVQPIPFCPVRKDVVIFLLPDRLMQFSSEFPGPPRTEVLRVARRTQLESFSGMVLARDGGLWIAGARGLAKAPGPMRNLKSETEWREFVAPEPLQIQNLQEPQEDGDGGVTVVAESTANGQTIVAHFDGQNWTTLPVGAAKIRYAWRGPDKVFWAATTDALYQLEEGRSEMIENEDIFARRYFDLAVEPGGAFWLATSDGLFRCAPPAWRSPGAVQQVSSLVCGLAEDAEGRLWFIAGGKLHSLANEVHHEYALPEAAAGDSFSVPALFPLKDGTLLLDTGEQSFRFHPASGSFSALPIRDDARQMRPLGLLKDGSLCLQSWNSDEAAGSRTTRHLALFDGAEFKPLPDPPPDSGTAGLFSVLFAARNGDLWLSGDDGIAWRHEQKWQTFPSNDKTVPGAAVFFAELPDGKIWCAAPDKIWEFGGKNWLTVRAGFDRITALLRARDGSVWVASSGGLHRFFQGAWVENGPEEGLPSAAVEEIREDQRGRIWAATTHGLGLYHPEADPDPPRAVIQQLPEAGNSLPEGGSLTLIFTGQDKWKYTPRHRLLYSHRLDEREWSPFDEANEVSFTDLPAGKHVFQVRAMDRNGNVDPNPARLEFAVALPWYREARLVLIGFTGLAVALFFAGLAFNRHRQLLRSYAEVEKKVAERTHELEIANRELLHSQKMNALGTLAAGIAHDFNNILSIVKGSAQIIEDNLDNPQKVRTRVDRIKTVVEQGAGIVKAMLGFSRGSDEPPGLCNLNAVVEDTIKLLGDRFLRDVEVSFESVPDLPAVPATKDFIQQILLNFIFNAAESMAGRGRVILSTRRTDKLPADPVLMPAQAAAYVSVSVRDFGCGIPPENLPRIFEPFFTTKAFSVRRGTGLGLSMAYELARKLQAGLAVESVVNQGSTFTLILAVRDLPPEAEA